MALPGTNCCSRHDFVPHPYSARWGEPLLLPPPALRGRTAPIHPDFGALQHPSKQRLPPGAPPRCGYLWPVREEGAKSDVLCSLPACLGGLQRQLILMGSPFIPKSTRQAQANLLPAGSSEFGR